MKQGNNFFTDNESIRSIDRFRIVYVLIAVSFFFITEIGRKLYRPYIYSNDIDDFGLADSIGNLGGIIVQIFLTLAVLNSPKRKALRVIGFISIGYVIYEVLQPYLPRGVFDWKDIYGTAAGGIISILIWLVINTLAKNKTILRL